MEISKIKDNHRNNIYIRYCRGTTEKRINNCLAENGTVSIIIRGGSVTYPLREGQKGGESQRALNHTPLNFYLPNYRAESTISHLTEFP